MSKEPSHTKPALQKSPFDEESGIADYVAHARQRYATESKDIEIDEKPEVSIADGGAWVSAWVWVDQEDADLHEEKQSRIS
jgi:hypothetical protein